MNLADIIPLSNIYLNVNASSKKALFKEIAAKISNKLNIEQNNILEKLNERERLGSTGIGNGIAIPHGKLSNSNKAVAVLIVNDNAINYDAIDKRPVDVFCALLVPEDQCDTHLSTLASIAKIFDNKDVLRKIRRSESDTDLYNIIEAA